MTSQARNNFLDGVGALEEAVQESATFSQTRSGALLRRGLAVSIFNLLEVFVEERIIELAEYVNQGHLQFRNLPEKIKRAAVLNALEVAKNKLGRLDSNELYVASDKLGASLSATGGGIHLSPYTWLWSGSNMSVESFQLALARFHVKSPLESVRSVCARLGYPTRDINGHPLDLNRTLKEFANERHSAAHRSNHSISILWLSGISISTRMFAVGFDSLASASASALRAGDPGYLSNSNWCTSDKIKIRMIKERKDSYAEVVEGRSRAVQVGPDLSAVEQSAANRCGDGEVLAYFDINDVLIKWSIPMVG